MDSLEHFTGALLEVFKKNSRVTRSAFSCYHMTSSVLPPPRITQPLLVTLDLILSNAVFEVYLPLSQYAPHYSLTLIFPFPNRHTFLEAIVTLVREELDRSTNAKKLLAGVNV